MKEYIKAIKTEEGLLVVTYTVSTGLVPDVYISNINNIPVAFLQGHYTLRISKLIQDQLIDLKALEYA